MNYCLPQKTRYSRSSCLSSLFVIFLFFHFITPAEAYDVTLAWDPNVEENLEGYVLYVDDGISEILYEYVDTYPLEDIDEYDPTVKISDLRDDLAYYFVVTAYDKDGNESDYSDEICVINGGACPESWSAYRVQPVNPASLSSNSAGSGGSFSNSGGGGGGCFISTFSYTEKNKRGISSQHIILLLMYIGIICIFSMLRKKNIKT